VTTGHDVAGTDWAALAGADTLVVLMGGAALPEIAERLVALGKPRGTPVGVAKGRAGRRAAPQAGRGRRRQGLALRSLAAP
jgi:siroheme synthase